MMHKKAKVITILTATSLLISFGVSFAYDSERGTTTLNEAATMQEWQMKSKGHIERFEMMRQKMMDASGTNREAIQARVQEMRDAQREELERKRQEFRENLAKIKQARHRKLAERLPETMNRVNQNMSDAALRHIDAISLVIDKIETRTEIVEDAAGEDLPQIKEQIKVARREVEEAKTAVLAQKSKEYILEIDSEENLGSSIRDAMRQVKDDHKKLREEVLRPLRSLVKHILAQLKDIAANKGGAAREALEDDAEEEQTP